MGSIPEIFERHTDALLPTSNYQALQGSNPAICRDRTQPAASHAAGRATRGVLFVSVALRRARI